MSYEFTIFGSGISAKIISSLLARNGFKVCLISNRDHKKRVSNTNLVTFLSAGSLNYLSSMYENIDFFYKYPDIQTINCQLNSLAGNKAQSIIFDDNEKEFLGKIIKNTDLESFLDEEISRLGNINIITSDNLKIVENTTKGIKLNLENGDNIETELFILSSATKDVTEQVDIDFINKDLKQTALSIDMEGNIKNENCAFQVFTSDGPLALLPYSKNKASIVWSLKNHSNILLKDEEELSEQINKHLREYITSAKILSIERHKLQFSYAKNLCDRRIVILGNIAHNIHPIAGQGLNLSIKDIALFIHRMCKYTSLGYRTNNQIILNEFEIKRKLDVTSYSFGTLILDGVLSSNNKFINSTVRRGLGFIEKSKYLKQLFIRSATGKDFFKSF